MLCIRGSSTGRINVANDNYCIGRGITAIRARETSDNLFLEFMVQNAVKSLLALSAGSTFPNLDSKSLRTIQIASPPLPEQKAIARVLSDVDELIRECDLLIAKKRDIKQGTMQQLLTGKKRLPGFSGEWEVVNLDSVAEIIDPHPSHRAPKINSNGIPFVGIGDISIDGKIDYSTVRMVDESIYNEHNQRYKINEGLLGIGRVASIGKVVNLKDDIGKYTVSPTIAIIKSKNIFKNMLFYILCSKDVEKQFSSISNGSTRQSIGITILRKIRIPLPTFPEQKAIAQILSDMDAEIEALEKKRDKYKAIKQGMMQDLLTGKTRLINN